MYFDINYDRKAEVDSVILRPDENRNEDPDVLHEYSKMLKISNPSIRFVKLAKEGKFNHYSDQEYRSMLNDIKELNELLFKNRPSMNIFQLLADMMEQILKNYRFSQTGTDRETGNGTSDGSEKSP